MSNINLLTLAKKLGLALKAKKLFLTTAESCTGGLVSASITAIAGSSQYFERGFVTYSNEAKIALLGVKIKTLEKYGAISEQVAKEMALGALKNSQAQISLAISGIAGPSGGSLEKPVGTVCFALVITKQKITTVTKHFLGNRQAIRKQAAIFALNYLLQHLAS